MYIPMSYVHVYFCPSPMRSLIPIMTLTPWAHLLVQSGDQLVRLPIPASYLRVAISVRPASYLVAATIFSFLYTW